ncbi:MAG: hypothetical protein R3A51_15175 [Nannocystaceae bacterium]|nr:hypothetical protein [Myxococcales bacterium]
MHTRDLPISRPCPVDLDAAGVDRSGKQFFCDHCQKDVHVLSNMTRSEAREFMDASRGQSLCISYARNAAGEVRFAPEAPAAPLVPLARLRTPAARPRASRPLAASFGLALAACTPHGEAPPITDDTIEAHDAGHPFMAIPIVEQEYEMVGEIEAEPPPVVEDVQVVAGGIGPAPEEVAPELEIEDEPCDKPPVDPVQQILEPDRHDMVRGRLRRPDPEPAPEPETFVEGKIELVDGGIDL